MRKHVKNVHGEDAFRQKKHKRTDDQNEKRFEENKENLPQTIQISTNVHSIGWNNQQQSNIVMENVNNNDDDEDVIVDQGIPDNIDVSFVVWDFVEYDRCLGVGG